MAEVAKQGRAPCSFYLKNNSCAYGAGCRFRHVSQGQLSAEGHVGDATRNFPRNPGAGGCNFYMRTGKCAYGMSCKYDHPPKGEISNSTTDTTEKAPGV
ncbi:unnamed protein product [Heterosigma akashiwo]